MSRGRLADLAESGREGLEKLAESELREIAAAEGIDDSLDAGEIVDLLWQAVELKEGSKKEKKEFIKTTGVSAALTVLQTNCLGRYGIAGAVGGTVIAVGAVVVWWFV